MVLEFERSAWDVASWKPTLLDLSREGEVEQVKALQAGPSRVKDLKDGSEGGATDGNAAEVGNEG
ncbi:hypothetical protein Hanom_Chr04g00297941 [Helianthus anomalus]